MFGRNFLLERVPWLVLPSRVKDYIEKSRSLPLFFDVFEERGRRTVQARPRERSKKKGERKNHISTLLKKKAPPRSRKKKGGGGFTIGYGREVLHEEFPPSQAKKVVCLGKVLPHTRQLSHAGRKGPLLCL